MSSKRNNLTAKLNHLRDKRDAELKTKAEKKQSNAEKRRKAHAVAEEIARILRQ